MERLTGPARGLKFMSIAVLCMLARYLLEVVLTVMMLDVDSLPGLASLVTWTARLHWLDLSALALFMVGVGLNLGELRRRRWSPVAAVVALVAFAGAFAFHAWLTVLLGDVAAALRGETRGFDVGRLDAVPRWTLVATVAYAVGLSATVRVVRAYSMTDGNLGLREQARAIGGMLILLIIADTFYRFTYGLGAITNPMGMLGVAAAVGLMVFWFWCHRQLGALFESARYYLRAAGSLPTADVVRHAPADVVRHAPAPAPVPPPAPIAPAPAPRLVDAPLAGHAPTAPAATPTDGAGPRLLR
ncbi:MAG: hypothetical protein R3B06_03415 [Kofleriaceae bacterium]